MPLTGLSRHSYIAAIGGALEVMASLVRLSAEIDVQHITMSGDAFEMGSSWPLDFWQWAAHKLEQLTYKLHHGEAVAIGIALDVTYSHLMGFLNESRSKRVLQVLADVGFELTHPLMRSHFDDPGHPDCLFAGLRESREPVGGQLTITLLEGIERNGKGFDVHEIDEPMMIQSLSLLESTWQRMRDGERLVESRSEPREAQDGVEGTVEIRKLAEVGA